MEQVYDGERLGKRISPRTSLHARSNMSPDSLLLMDSTVAGRRQAGCLSDWIDSCFRVTMSDVEGPNLHRCTVQTV